VATDSYASDRAWRSGRARLLGIVAVVAILAGHAPAAHAQTISSRAWSTVQPGMRLLTGRTTSPTTRFWALEISLCTDYVHVAATSAPTARRTVPSWGAAAGVTAAVNGDFFRTDTATPVVYGQAVGNRAPWPAARTGEGTAATTSWYYRNYGWIAFGPSWAEFAHTEAVRRAGGTTSGFRPGRATTGEIPAGTVALVSGFPELVTEGRTVTCSSPTATTCFPDRSDMRSRNPRTAMGLSADRRTFYLVVVDGRSSVSAGMYGTELARLMAELGAWQAFNLDGGGSTTLWLDGRGTVNVPSDGTPRAVANHWGVFAGSATGRARAPGSCIPADVDDCFGASADGAACGEQEAILATTDLGRSTDVDGDGRADLCARAAAGYGCRLSTGASFTAVGPVLDALSDASGFDVPAAYATLRTGDVNGDGRADVCARSATGVSCWTSTGTGWSAPIAGPPLDDARGWSAARYYTTLRLADVDGDGDDDLCARAASGVQCWLSDGAGFATTAIVGPAWSDAAGFDAPAAYGTLRVGDIDGNGADELCARTPSGGLECYAWDGAGLGLRFAGPAWTDARGFGAVKYWSTLRLADVSGDGRADACIRTAAELRCHLANGAGFDATSESVAALSDALGWGTHDHYATLRAADLDADDADELCARANAGLRCWDRGADGTWSPLTGPPLDDASGWNAPRFYETIRLGDLDADGRADFCARGASGVFCWPSTGTGFGSPLTLAAYSDASGWGEPGYFGTLRLAGGFASTTPPPDAGAPDDAGLPSDDAGDVSTDAGRALVDAEARPPAALRGGCVCAAGGRGSGGATLALAWALLGAVLRRAARRAARLRV
jgi:hypothetical protein